ncbi:AraC family transcriptional regulator [Chitinophaga sp. YIM B06452]|uniref:helix-turn-helix domain-containing protein n=1 Tax=Chitinophaga sp. YIM B06452 TaxID=3082158 RepID=UPI0031FEA42A
MQLCNISRAENKGDTGTPGATGIYYFDGQLANEGCLCPEDNTLLFISEGEFIFQYGESTFEARALQAVFLRKQILVRYHSVSASLGGTGAGFLLFVLKKSIVQEFIRSAHLQPVCHAPSAMLMVHRPGQRLLACLHSVKAYFTDGAGITGHLAKIKLLEVLFCLAGCRQEQPVLELALDLRERFRGDINSVVEEHLMNTHSLSQLARLSGRSLSSFRRDFQAIYNMPPSRWIRLRRLEKACELLAGTQMTITHICYTLGFENIAHFSRIFKARFGIPPSLVRNNALFQQLQHGRLAGDGAHSLLV